MQRTPWPRPPALAIRPNAALLGADAWVWAPASRFALTSWSRSFTATGEGSPITPAAVERTWAAGAWSRVAGAGVNFGAVQPASSDTGITVLVVAAPSASANRKILFSQRLGSGSVATFGLYANTTGTVGISAGAMTLYCRNTVAAGCPVTVTSAGIDGAVHCWVFANGTTSGDGYAYRDGNALTLTTNTALTGTFVTAAQETRVGNGAAYSTDGALVNDDPLYLVIAWPRRIPPEMARKLSALLVADIGDAFSPLLIPAFAFASSGAVTHTASGSPAAQAATLAGTATRYALHTAAGTLASQAATVAGSATHLSLHTATGALAAAAAEVAGTASHIIVHSAIGALEAQAATIAGAADHTTPGAFSADGTLSAQEASIAGTAQRLALHTASGALEAGSATVDGTAVVPVTHTATGALAAGSASVGGTAQNGEIVATQQPAGRPSKDRRRRRRVVEVDGRIYSVNSDDEAQQLLDTVRQQAEEKAEQAVKRAAQAAKRPARKVIADARKALVVPKIAAPGLEDYAERVVSEIAEAYASAMRSVEIAALLRKREQELEADDEDVLMLIV